MLPSVLATMAPPSVCVCFSCICEDASPTILPFHLEAEFRLYLYAGRCSVLTLSLLVVNTQPGQKCADAKGHLYVNISKDTCSRPLHVDDECT